MDARPGLASAAPRLGPNLHLFLAKLTANAPQDPASMHTLLLAAAGGSDGQTQLLPQQTNRWQDSGCRADYPAGFSAGRRLGCRSNDGSHDGLHRPSSYLIQRIDTKGVDAQGTTVDEESMDITKYETVSLPSVLPGTFSFTPPAGVTILRPNVACPTHLKPAGRTSSGLPHRRAVARAGASCSAGPSVSRK